jgi:predicted TIM-barrel fold metal-dependent hydrolase
MPPPRAHALIQYMDEAGVDVCFALRESMMDVAGYATCMSTNAFIQSEIAPYPDRMFLEANVGPVIRRGAKHAIWELEHLVKNGNARLCRSTPEDGPLNDKRLWPFYEKACELDIALTIHTGMSYVCPQPSKYTHPSLLDDVCLDFPDLKIIAYHMAWPHHEELMGLAGKHRNLFESLGHLVGWRALKRLAMIGEALQWVSDDKIVMGLDLAFDDMGKAVDYIRNLQMPEELQEKWGYPEITEDMRAKFLGLNLARLAKIEPTKRVKKKG